ncbi:hypothetical protein [Asticcacaulis endophyticus]|uniref:Uncharacterized protein n=1 Tax=Asticcacaulis endophyticus TaxID=1395890 RepID=A0A918QD33_9CAUL|nr:hypothetical protein [Asticcacaulis endophyticus]GGZ39198.1 hypothetical protein GCM10011273_27020 [Asticcacaulis endophyticus]
MIEILATIALILLPILAMVAEVIRRRIDARPRQLPPHFKPKSAIPDDPSEGVRVKGRGVRVRIKK